MSLIHGNSKWTDAELRNYLEQAHNSARDKWGAYLSDLSIAYWSAYQTFLKTLNLLEIAAKSNQQNSELFWNVILPAVAGGFIGSIAGSKLREVLENIDTNLRTTISDTAKTVVTDVTKYTTRQVEKAFLDNFQANPWKSDEVEPAKFSEVLKNKILHYLVEVDDVLISAKKSKIPNVYRNILSLSQNPKMFV